MSEFDEVRYVGEPLAPGEIGSVAEGVFHLRLGLPFQLDHVNLWLIAEDDGWTAIDAGFADAPSRAAWEAVERDFLRGAKIRRVIATHFHPDHIGLAGWLCARHDAPLLAPRLEWTTARMLALDASDDFVEAGRRFAVRAGLPAELIVKQAERGNRYRLGVTLPPASHVSLAEETPLVLGGERASVRFGRGHAPEMATFHLPERNLLISADQILPRISPNVGVWPSAPEEDPLGDFLASLKRYEDLPDDALTLPSHDRPFTGLKARLRQLAEHHEQRLSRALDALDRPRTAHEVLATLFPRALDLHQTGFAVGETLAHLRLLVTRGAARVESAAGEADRFSRL